MEASGTTVDPPPATRRVDRNVLLLALCQALFMSGTSLTVTVSTLVGFALAADKTLASLPFTVQLLATMVASIPAAALMARVGRKPGFMLGTVLAAGGAAICVVAVLDHHFWLFVLGSALIGIYSGFANYFRFAASDNAPPALRSRAISYVLAGGVLAAFIGPTLARLTRDLIPGAPFAGSFAAIIGLYVLSFLLLTRLHLPLADKAGQAGEVPARPLASIAAQPRYVIAVICGMLGYAVMSLVMTATPLAMQHHGHPFGDTAFVIQWHVVAMFAPAFVTGRLIERLGLLPVLFTGVVFAVLTVAINLTGSTTWHFWTALVLLGLSWNFLFVGATTLLSDTYAPAERFKAQALNDFTVFSVVGMASLSAGALQTLYGWQAVNLVALPMLAIILIALSILWRLTRPTRTL